jgi:hypothetical protein
MTALALIAGAIFKAAERRESKTAGRSFVVATMALRQAARRGRRAEPDVGEPWAGP